MKQLIREFIYVSNPSFTPEENIRISNRSAHPDPYHQSIFWALDEFAQRVIRDLHNEFSSKIFQANHLVVVADEKDIAEAILSSLNDRGLAAKKLNNPENIYRAFNFEKPGNLLPAFTQKLVNIQQKGISASGVETDYVFNPLFLGYLESVYIFMTNMFCCELSPNLQEGLVKIFSDKYGKAYETIYYMVEDIGAYAIKECMDAGKTDFDGYLIKKFRAISGLTDEWLFNAFVYNAAVSFAQARQEYLQKP